MSSSKQLKGAELKKAEERKIEQIIRKKRARKIITISLLLITIISAVIIISVLKNPTEYDKGTESTQTSDVISDTEVGIPISDINDKPTFYSYDADGVEVKYFAIKGSDGEIHIAFDACDVCYREKKGYRQDGANMQCINCGNMYPINSLGTENTAGGCWPSYLPIRIDNGQVIIEKSDLEQKKWMF
jgi:uncharacterized membrane protein